ncbi:sulfatase [Halovenus sp. HT40]|uniref:sulfatase n=1 Tax=Halovenus sp. HT40 TaxID=3126691 RepID=UPI00300F6176
MLSPNVLLVVLDSVRAQNTSMHGYSRDTTPNIAEFAERATVYKQAKSPGVWTLASHTSMFTGYHVEEHLLTFNDHVIEPGHSVWEGLSDRGYQTGVFSHNPFLTGGTGLEAGFDTAITTNQEVPFSEAVDPYDYADDYVEFIRAGISDGTPIRSVLNGVVAKFEPEVLDGLGGWEVDKTPATRCIDTFLDWHESRSDGPWGACLNLMDAHWPYQPHELNWASEETVALATELESESLWKFEGGQRPWSEWEAMEDLYDDCIRQADAAVGHMLRTLEERGDLENTLVIITGDHGEAFGEQSAVRDVTVREHGSGAIHESVVHVPLVVNWPGETGGKVVDSPTSLTWLKDAIEQATLGELESDPLQRPDKPVLASTHGLDPDETKYKKGTKYVDNMAPFQSHSRAVYEDVEGGVRKYADSKIQDRPRTSATIYVSNTGERSIEADTDSGRTESEFADIENMGVKRGSIEIDDQMESRLADLGYM